MREFWGATSWDRLTVESLGLALLLAILSAWAGLACGGWLSRVKR